MAKLFKRKTKNEIRNSGFSIFFDLFSWPELQDVQKSEHPVPPSLEDAANEARPKPQTLKALNPKPETRSPKPQVPKGPKPETLLNKKQCAVHASPKTTN